MRTRLLQPLGGTPATEGCQSEVIYFGSYACIADH